MTRRREFPARVKVAAFERSGGLLRDQMCGVVGCERVARGSASGTPVCHMHYQRWKKHGQFDLPERRLSSDGTCTAPGCDKAVRSTNAAYCNAHYHRVLRGSRDGLSPVRTKCLQCGAHLTKNQSKYCSARCQTRHVRGTPLARECVICSTIFPTWERRTTCSDECLAALQKRWVKRCYDRMMSDPIRRAKLHAREYRRKAAKRRVVHEDFDPMEIFVRDGWICQLCHGRVWRHVKWPHPKYPSIDHIVPLSDGGEHTRRNVQCAHLLCNVRKSNRAGGQMRLFG